jgi:hypothetical protein
VPADAQWVVHADLAALRDTALGQKLIERLPGFSVPAAGESIRPNFAKVMETVGSATAFGTDLTGKPEAIDGALVLQGTADLRKIAEGLIAQMSLAKPEDAVELKDLPFEGYVVSKELFVAFPAEPIVLVSKSRAQLVKAYDVFRGRAPSLAKQTTPLTALLPKDGQYYLVAATMVPSAQQLFSGTGPEARILQMAQSGSLAIGERGDLAAARVQLVASSSEVATKLTKILEGITAMLSLAESSDQRLTEFVNALKVSRSENTVSLAFAYPTERILQLIETPQRTASSSPASVEVEGQVVAQWTANQELGGDAPTGHNFATHAVDTVPLTPGATIILTGQRERGEHARWDYIELRPVGGSGAPQRFEAEFMRLQGYDIERMSSASGGEIIKANGAGTARLRFTGSAGNYQLTARYVDETDGTATMTISTLPAESASN